MTIATQNPATEETVKVFDELSDEQLESCLDLAAAGFERQRSTSFAQRAGWMRRAAEYPGSRY